MPRLLRQASSSGMSTTSYQRQPLLSLDTTSPALPGQAQLSALRLRSCGAGARHSFGSFLGSIFIGGLHDMAVLVVSLRNRGMTIGEIAGRLLNPRVRLLFLILLLFALWVVLAIFGWVIANVFVQFPEAILPVFLQIPIAILIGTQVHRRGRSLRGPSLVALAMHVRNCLAWGRLPWYHMDGRFVGCCYSRNELLHCCLANLALGSNPFVVLLCRERPSGLGASATKRLYK